MPDEITLKSAALSDELRRWLRKRAESREVQAAALAYELAALVAREYATEADAIALLDSWVAGMKEQIHLFGVGVEHP